MQARLNQKPLFSTTVNSILFNQKYMNKYLKASTIIDWETPSVYSKAQQLSQGIDSPVEIAKQCFKYVRDKIKHSYDYQLNPVTCTASEVLKFKTGYCYAKSHLLAALLRANEIPAGLCYQRLTIENNQPPFCLHGLNAVFLPDYGWYRIDARGNKAGIHAEFIPPEESLAFRPITKGEADIKGIWAEPLEIISQLLSHSESFEEVANNLPDIDPKILLKL